VKVVLVSPLIRFLLKILRLRNFSKKT
jgi:hypothetical protein